MGEQLQIIQNPEQTYTTIRQSIVHAQRTMAAAVNSAMVTAYWEIGEQIYKALVDDCDVAHITKINFAYDADAYFPNLDEKPEWQITADSEEQTYFDLEFFFYKYEKIK